VDGSLPDGGGIVIEERNADEVLAYGGVPVSPVGAVALNPAFDVTPVELITAVVTERRSLP
jgi:methylthioribose-1-phosphate isomerase